MNGLSPKMADSLKMLVTAPFEQLTGTVEAFDRVVREASRHQQTVAQGLGESAAALAASKESLAAVLTGAQACVAQFQASAEQLGMGAQASAEIVRQAEAAAGSLIAATGETQAATERYADLGAALSQTVKALVGADEALRENVSQFRAATEHIEQTVAGVQALTESGIRDNVAVVQGELQGAIGSLVHGLKESSEQAVRAHEEGMVRIAAAFDSAVEGMTERLSNDLTQITASLPDEVEKLNRTMGESRLEILQAYEASTTRTKAAMEESVADLTGRIVSELSTLSARFPEQVKELNIILAQTHTQTVSAYQSSSERVIDTIDERISDLTDRLEGALSTLTSRLPEEVSVVSQALSQAAGQVKTATRSMDDALRQLAVQTPQALAAQYREFDSALATAMKHFSGTLLGWEGRVADLHRLAVALQAIVDRLPKGTGPGNGKPAEAVA